MNASDERRWAAALDEHERVLGAFAAACEQVPGALWHEAPAPGRWAPSEVALHVCRTYELGRDASAGGPGMRLRVAPGRAWMLRTLLLPAILRTKRFPRGVPAPAEVRPDAAAAKLLTREAAIARLATEAKQAADGLRRMATERPGAGVVHAYFGTLPPLAGLRLLSAHTRHHARELMRRARVAPIGRIQP